MNKSIKVEAVIIEYIYQAMTDEYDSGGFAVYDATLLRITSPVSFKDMKISIYHDREITSDSIWRETGQLVQFDIESNLLENRDVVFDGAVNNLKKNTIMILSE